MVLVVGFLMFLSLSAATWFVAVAVYRSLFAGPDPAAMPGYRRVAVGTVLAETITCFRPFPEGYVLGIVVWVVAVFGFLDLPRWKAAALACLLAVGSYLNRLMVLGVLDVT